MNTNSNTQKPLWKRIVRKVHLWISLTIMLPLVFIATTGILLSGIFVTKEIQNSFSYAQNYIVTPAEIGKIVNVTNDYTKDGFQINSIRIPEKITGEITVYLTQNNDIMRVMMEPQSLRIIKTEYGNTLEKVIEKLHSSFFLEKGKTIVGFIGVFLCIVCISGVIIWIPKRNNLKNSAIPRFSLRGRALYVNLHKAFGIWCALFLVVIGLTGVSLALTKQFRDIISHFSYTEDFKMPKSQIYQNINIENIVMNAMNSVKNNGIIAVQMPKKFDDPYQIILRQDARYKISIFVDGSGKILEIRNPKKFSNGAKFMLWMGFIHKGTGMGIMWRVLQIFFGGTIVLFSITGFLIWVKKKKNKV